MSIKVPTVAVYRSDDSKPRRRSENVALAFQEVITAIVRLRSKRQNVTDAELFRGQFREGLRMAQETARSRGYTDEDTQLATFAVVAFLDESVLSADNPALASWPRMPLQEQMFRQGHVAGETFFHNVEEILRRKDSQEVADLLEVYQMCLLLGYRGRFGTQSSGVRNIVAAIDEKLRRIRGAPGPLCPQIAIPSEAPQRRKTDVWLRRLRVVLVVFFVLALASFVAFSVLLHSGIERLQG